jgi:outer membrane lipoprotein SlyB
LQGLHVKAIFLRIGVHRLNRIFPLAATGLLLAACASTGPDSAAAIPVLYPNDKLTSVGDEQAQVEVAACRSRAVASGLGPSQKSNEVSRRAGEGGATAGVAAAVGAFITGRSNDALRGAASGGVIGGAAGAVSGSFNNDKPNSVYRTFVQRCLTDKGFDVIGWN